MMGRRGGPLAARVARWHGPLRFIFVCLVALLVTSVNSMTMDVDDGSIACAIVVAKQGNTINANFEVLGYPVKNTMVILQKRDDNKLLYRKEDLGEDYFRVDATNDGEYELCFINGGEERIKSLRNKFVHKGNSFVGLNALRQEKKKKALAQQREDEDDDSFFYRDDEELLDGLSDDMPSWYAKESGYKTFGFGLRLGKDVDDLQSMADVSVEDKVMASFLTEEADILVETLSVFNDHESYMRGREVYHRENVKQTSSRLMWCTFVEAAVLVWVSWTQLSYIRRFFETKRIL
ncbi:unnamed protein product [Ectocarpus sp. 12 AP-2014]